MTSSLLIITIHPVKLLTRWDLFRPHIIESFT
jgi:hypothetical protein